MLKDIEMMMMMLTIRMMKDHIDDNDNDDHTDDASSHMLASKINPCACTATTCWRVYSLSVSVGVVWGVM